MELSLLSQWPTQLLTYLLAKLPCCCALCGCTNRQMLCDDCHHLYFSITPLRCIQCANHLTPATRSSLCAHCLTHPKAFDRTIVVCDYSPPIDQLVLALKFRAQLSLAPLFANMLLQTIHTQQSLCIPDILIAVPLSPARLQQRGFNQALEIAKPLARLLQVRLQRNLLQRERDTPAQSLTGNIKERQHNLRHAFSITSGKSLENCHIGVVDDVMTSGETLHAAATTLRKHGARHITNFVFARTP